jgi:hypothetical protein
MQIALGQPRGLAFPAADEADVGVQSLVGEIAVLDRDEHRLREEGAVDQADLDCLARAVLRMGGKDGRRQCDETQREFECDGHVTAPTQAIQA